MTMSMLRTSRLVWGLVFVVLASGCLVVWASNRHPSTDPHGARPQALRALVAALPPSLPILSEQANEPARSTCDGETGWGPVYLQAEIASGHRTTGQVFQAVGKVLTAAGWHRDPSRTTGQPLQVWSSNTPRRAQAVLLVDERYPRASRWRLTLSAAPNGNEVGC